MEKRRDSSFLVLLMVVVMVAFVTWGVSQVFAQSGKEAVTGAGVYRGVSTAVHFDVSPSLNTISPVEIKTDAISEIPERDSGLEGQLGPQDVDPLVQSIVGPNLIPTPIVSFDGPGNLASVSPPDPVGDVGPNHYVAMSNLYFAVYDKVGNVLSPSPNNTLWAGLVEIVKQTMPVIPSSSMTN
ncbi:MAG: hypothetical protein R3E31_06680 [Chloroflexota bacterium]